MTRPMAHPEPGSLVHRQAVNNRAYRPITQVPDLFSFCLLVAHPMSRATSQPLNYLSGLLCSR